MPTDKNLRGFFDLMKKLNIEVCGVSFHVGSGCMSEKSYEDALTKCRYVFDFALKNYSLKLSIIDLGGGFIQDEPLLSNVSKTILTKLEELFNWRPGDTFPYLMAEPGRFMAANVFDLYVQIVGKKASGSESPIRNFKYYVNNSVYGDFNGKFFDFAVFKYTLLRKDGTPIKIDEQTHVFPSIIFGTTCDSLDKIIDDVKLPELYIGDYILVKELGAYSQSSSSQFNGIPNADVWLHNDSDQR
jgi:ornithine decarboxylase